MRFEEGVMQAGEKRRGTTLPEEGSEEIPKEFGSGELLS